MIFTQRYLGKVNDTEAVRWLEKSKIIAAVAETALIVGFSAMNVSAWGWGNGGDHTMGQEMMYGNGATNEERQKFLDDTKNDSNAN